MVKSTFSLNRAIKHCIITPIFGVLLVMMLLYGGARPASAVDGSPSDAASWSCPNGGTVQNINILGTGGPAYWCYEGQFPGNAVDKGRPVPVTEAAQAQQQQNQQAVDQANAQIQSDAFVGSGSCRFISLPFRNVFCQGQDINKNPVSVVGWITTILTGVLGLALVITLLISAIQLITAGASPEMAASAKKRISIAALSLGLLIGLQAILALIGI